MPMGLDAAIKKRTSGEFKMEVIKKPQPLGEENFVLHILTLIKLTSDDMRMMYTRY